MMETEGSDERSSQHLLKLFKANETRLNVFANGWDIPVTLPVLFAASFMESPVDNMSHSFAA